MSCSDAYRANAPFAKLVPLSVMMLLGTPYLQTMSGMNRTAVGQSSFLFRRASIHLANLSMATRRCVTPPRAFLNGPTISKPQTANGHAIGIVFSVDAGW